MLFLSVGSALSAGAAAASGSGSTWLVIIALAVVGSWIISLRLHPFTACSACKGSPRLFGLVATRSFRICSTCGGNGRRKRYMANIWARNRVL